MMDLVQRSPPPPKKKKIKVFFIRVPIQVYIRKGTNVNVNPMCVLYTLLTTVQLVNCRAGLKPLVFHTRAILSLENTHPTICKAFLA